MTFINTSKANINSLISGTMNITTTGSIGTDLTITNKTTTRSLNIKADKAYDTEVLIQRGGPQANNNYGYQVDIASDGSRVIISEYQSDDGGTSTANYGKVYIWRNDGGGVWDEEQSIQSNILITGQYYGTRVSMNGDGSIIAVAEPNPTATSTGIVHVYTRSGTTWSSFQDLNGANYGAAIGYAFGFDLHISKSGNDLFVGSYEDDTGGTNRGKAYYFTLTGGQYEVVQTLTQNTPANQNQFGREITTSGDAVWLFISGSRSGTSNTQGSFDVFKKIGTTYTYKQTLSETIAKAYLGENMAANHDGSVMIASMHDRTTTVASLGIYKRNADEIYSLLQRLDDPPPATVYFSLDCDIKSDGSKIVVGHLGKDLVYVYNYNSDTGLYSTTPDDTITSSNTPVGQFGRAVAIADNNTIVVGDDLYMQGGLATSGRAHIFEDLGGTTKHHTLHDGGVWHNLGDVSYMKVNSGILDGVMIGRERPCYGGFNTINSRTLKLTDTTEATSKTSGALQVFGGVGVSGSIYANRVYGSYFDIQSVEASLAANNSKYILASAGAGNGSPYVASHDFEIVSWTLVIDGNKTASITTDRWYAGGITTILFIAGTEDIKAQVTMNYDDANLSTFSSASLTPTPSTLTETVYRTYTFSSPISVSAGQTVVMMISTDNSFSGGGPEATMRLNCFTK